MPLERVPVLVGGMRHEISFQTLLRELRLQAWRSHNFSQQISMWNKRVTICIQAMRKWRSTKPRVKTRLYPTLLSLIPSNPSPEFAEQGVPTETMPWWMSVRSCEDDDQTLVKYWQDSSEAYFANESDCRQGTLCLLVSDWNYVLQSTAAGILYTNQDSAINSWLKLEIIVHLPDNFPHHDIRRSRDCRCILAF